MSETAHKHKAESPKSVNVFIVTCSTSKYWSSQEGKDVDDKSGDIIQETSRKAGHNVRSKKLIPDNEAMLKQTLTEALADKNVDAIIITGGTGISPRDITIEVVEGYLEKTLPGFGELFRKISFDSIGSSAMMTRATAGVAKGKVIFCLPGSPNAVETAMNSLILPEMGHVIKIAREK